MAFKYRYTLRAVFVAVALAAIPLWWLAREMAEFRAEQAALAELAPSRPLISLMKQWPGYGSRVMTVILQHSATDEDVARLQAFQHLEGLDLRNNDRFSDAALAHAARLPHLKEMDLWNVPITDEGVRRLAELQTLDDLGLRSTLATEACLSNLARLPNLRRLVLQGMPLGEQGVAAIKTFPLLEVLLVDGAYVSQETVDALQRARPRTSVLRTTFP
ncbi:MAG: hypothetical protein AB7O59_12150 [Pirellulales bacterium]